jgi:hypothetical protein
VPLEKLLRDKALMMKLFLVAFWSSLVIMAIGFYFIVRDLVG